MHAPGLAVRRRQPAKCNHRLSRMRRSGRDGDGAAVGSVADAASCSLGCEPWHRLPTPHVTSSAKRVPCWRVWLGSSRSPFTRRWCRRRCHRWLHSRRSKAISRPDDSSCARGSGPSCRGCTDPDNRHAPDQIQRRFVFLRLRFNVVLSDFDMFADALTQRSEQETGPWLAGLDVAADDGLAFVG